MNTALLHNRFLFCAIIAFSLFMAAPQAFSTNVSEPPDFPNTTPGPATVLTLGANVFSGAVTTPNDGQDRFNVIVPTGFRITQATKNFAAGGGVQSANVNFNGEDIGGTGTGLFASNYPLGPGTYSAIISAGFSIGNAWSMVITLGLAPDYSVSTSSGSLTVTDNLGNSDTLSVTNPAAGNIKFAVAGRTFSVNGGALITNDSGNISLTGISDITVYCGNGNDTVNVSGFSGSNFPSLALYGGAGNNTVNFNGSITFATNNYLDVELQNSLPDTNTINLAPNATLITKGTGTISMYCSRNISLSSASSLVVENGDLNMAANQQIPATKGNFTGIILDGATIKSTGSGVVTIDGTGGDDSGGYQLGINIVNGAKVIGGNNYVFLTGNGGASTNFVNRGVTVYGAGSAITSSNGSVYVTGRAGYAGSYFGIGVSILFGAEISAGGSGLLTVTGNGNGAIGSGYNQGIEIGGAGGSRIRSAGNNVDVNASAGSGASYGIYLADDAAITAPAAGGSIEFYADSISIGNSTSITTTNAGSHVRFKAGAPSNKIDLGGADASLTLGLSNDELARVNTANFEFFNPSGSITISAPITNATATNMTFITGVAGVIPSNVGVDIVLPVGTVNINQASPLICTINGSTPDSSYSRLNVIGKVNLTNTTLVVNGSYTGAIGDSFTIVENDGTDPIISTFAGLPQGSYLKFNGQLARIYYNGGTGNDVVLVRSLPELSSTRRLTNGNWQFTGIGLPSNSYTIQATTNFITWTNLGFATGNSNGIFSFIDSNAFRFNYRFYRTTN